MLSAISTIICKKSPQWQPNQTRTDSKIYFNLSVLVPSSCFLLPCHHCMLSSALHDASKRTSLPFIQFCKLLFLTFCFVKNVFYIPQMVLYNIHPASLFANYLYCSFVIGLTYYPQFHLNNYVHLAHISCVNLSISFPNPICLCTQLVTLNSLL